jgi:membrane protease YdiL (CAAX protease family)
MARIEQTGSTPGASPQARQPTPRVEALLAFLGVTAVVSVLYHVRGVPFLERNLAVVAAVLFLYVPALLLWRRGHELEQFALRGRPIGKGLLLYVLFVAAVLPLFAFAYHFYLRRGCPLLYRALGSYWQLYLRCPPPIVPALRLPPEFPVTALSQLLVVALPEEFFFRGFLLGRLCETMPKPKALVASALLFALGHYLVTFQPAALAVFFPGLLFGLLRLTTGSILAGTLFHATCNLLIETLHRSLG